jgi:hypothetical protein
VQFRIDLEDKQPLVSGAYRDIYQHPHDENLLIKVVKPLAVERYAQRASIYTSWRGNWRYRNQSREIEEYLALRRRGQHTLPFIQHLVGVVDTDFGFGMVVRKVRGRDGELAPTIMELVERGGLTPEIRGRMADLLAEVVRNHIVFGDISGKNIVQADDEEHGNRLVIIDGLSDRLLLPVNSWSPMVNRVYCERRFARAIRRMEAVDRARLAGLRPEPLAKS